MLLKSMQEIFLHSAGFTFEAKIRFKEEARKPTNQHSKQQKFLSLYKWTVPCNCKEYLPCLWIILRNSYEIFTNEKEAAPEAEES